MNRVLRRVLVCTFVVGLSGIYVCKALWACGGTCGGNEEHSSHETSGHLVQAKTDVKGEKAEVVKDPVCGMDVGNVKKAPSEEYKGKVYYFCSEHCKKTFKKDPSSYVTQQGAGGEHKQ
jgi:YHS domain-containing protein